MAPLWILLAIIVALPDPFLPEVNSQRPSIPHVRTGEGRDASANRARSRIKSLHIRTNCNCNGQNCNTIYGSTIATTAITPAPIVNTGSTSPATSIVTAPTPPTGITFTSSAGTTKAAPPTPSPTTAGYPIYPPYGGYGQPCACCACIPFCPCNCPHKCVRLRKTQSVTWEASVRFKVTTTTTTTTTSPSTTTETSTTTTTPSTTTTTLVTIEPVTTITSPEPPPLPIEGCCVPCMVCPCMPYLPPGQCPCQPAGCPCSEPYNPDPYNTGPSNAGPYNAGPDETYTPGGEPANNLQPPLPPGGQIPWDQSSVWPHGPPSINPALNGVSILTDTPPDTLPEWEESLEPISTKQVAQQNVTRDSQTSGYTPPPTTSAHSSGHSVGPGVLVTLLLGLAIILFPTIATSRVYTI